MNSVGFLLLAFSPGVFWLWFFARKSVYRPDPRRLIIGTFFLGMIATIPAGILNSIFLDESIINDEANLASVALGMLFVVGPVEELSKFMAVRLVAYRSLYFDEPIDGLVYGAAASLGFASLENLFYILEFGPQVMILRAPLSTLAHVIFSSAWGYALGLQTQRQTRSRVYVAGGLIVAALLHATFNVVVFAFWPGAFVIVIMGGLWTLSRFNWAQRISPFRYRQNHPMVRCSNCQRNIMTASRFCRFCGSPALFSREALVCGHCGESNRPDALFCTRCGDRFLLE